jgi:hypothetical protein
LKNESGQKQNGGAFRCSDRKTTTDRKQVGITEPAGQTEEIKIQQQSMNSDLEQLNKKQSKFFFIEIKHDLYHHRSHHPPSLI